MPREFEYEVVKTYGSLSESDKGWKKEIKLISWNNREPKYDIREWSPDGEKMGKGVTLSPQKTSRRDPRRVTSIERIVRKGNFFALFKPCVFDKSARAAYNR